MLKRQRQKIENSTLEQFVRWLNKKPQTDALAYVYEGAGCPVRTFIEEFVRVEVFVAEDEIAEHFVDHGHPTKTVTTPAWIQKFILAIHTWADEKTGAKNRSERDMNLMITPMEIKEVLIAANMIVG